MENSLNLEPTVKPGGRKRDPNYPGHLLTDLEYQFTLDYLEELSEILFPIELKVKIEDCDLLFLL